jgi:hypothetical protein
MFKLGGIKTRLRFSPGLLSYAVLALSVLAFLYWRLAGLPDGLSQYEVLSRNASANLHGLATNPADAPYHLLQHLLYSLQAGILSLRLTSALIATFLILGFYRYMRSLFGRIIGLLGSLLLLSLPFFTVSARQAAPQIMLFLPLAVMYLFHNASKSDRKSPAWMALALLAGISAYTPGLIWWLVLSAAFTYRKLAAGISNMPKISGGIGAGLLCLSIAPLVVISALHPQSLKQLFLIPSDWPSPLHFGSELLHMIGSMFIRTQGQSQLLINNLPVLNIALIALAAFGGCALYTAARDKAIALGLSIVLAIVLASLQENIDYLALAVPALATAVTAGLRYLYVEWRGIFPRNPVPKTFAMVLIAAVALAQIYYGLDYSLRAWPRTPVVRQAYVLK